MKNTSKTKHLWHTHFSAKICFDCILTPVSETYPHCSSTSYGDLKCEDRARSRYVRWTLGRRVRPREQGASSGPAKQDGVFSLLKKKGKNVLGNESAPLFENHSGISLLTLLHGITPRTKYVCVCGGLWGSMYTPRHMWPSARLHKKIRPEFSQNSAQFGQTCQLFWHSPPSSLRLFAWNTFKKLPPNAGNN